MPYASPAKRAECARQACKRYYRRYHAEQLKRAARYRQSNRRLIRKRQQAWTSKKVAEDPTWHCRTALQTDWKRRCQRKGVFHSEPFLKLLGVPFETFCRYLEKQFTAEMTWQNYGSVWSCDHVFPLSAFRLNHRIERRMVCSFVNLVPLTVAENKTKNGKFDREQLAAYKTWWRRTFKRRDWRQRLLFDPCLIPDPRINRTVNGDSSSDPRPRKQIALLIAN